MDIVKATTKKLEYNNTKLKELESILEEARWRISTDAIEYLCSQIKRTNDNIKYYSEVLKAINNI